MIANNIINNDIIQNSSLHCQDGNKFFYIEYGGNIPNATIYDNHLLRNKEYSFKDFIVELSDIFKLYDNFVLDKFKISVKTDYDTIDTLSTGDLKGYVKDCMFPHKDKKELLLDYLHFHNDLFLNIILCKIVLIKPLSYQKEWKPHIPVVTEKRTPRKELNFKRNIKNFSGTAKQHILSRDNKTCQHCGRTIEDGVKLHIDHIIPKSKGGYGDIWNGQVLCNHCNHEKHNNDNLRIDKDKLSELKEYYNIHGSLQYVNGRFSYYDSDGNVVGRFTRNDIKNFG